MGLIKKTAGAIKVNLVDMLIFELLYRILVFPFFLFLLEQGLKASMRTAGFSYITAENLAKFLLWPVTAVLFVLMLLAVLCAATVEAGALLTAFEGAAYSRRVRPGGMLWGGLRKAADELGKRNKRLFFLLGGGALFIQMVPLYLLLSRIKPVNFVMDELLALRAGRWGAGIVLLLLAIWLAPRAFMPQYSLIEQKAYRDSRWESFSLFKKKWAQGLALFAGGNLVLAAVMAAAYLLAEFFTAAAVMVLGLTACGGGSNEGRTGDTMETYFFDFTVNSAYLTSDYAGYTPAEGNVLLVADITVKNTFQQSFEMYDVDFQAQWDDGDDAFAYPITTDMETYTEVDPVGEDQLPGTYSLAVDEERTGELVYEVPSGFTDFSIAYLEQFVDDSGEESTGETYFVYFTAEDQTGVSA